MLNRNNIQILDANFVKHIFQNMKAGIITIGDEILIGQVVDTNSAWMGKHLNEIGWDISEIRSIKDHFDAISNSLDSFIGKYDLVLISGGLGPTKDDITKNCLCSYFKTELILDKNILAFLEKRYNDKNAPLKEAILHQAYVPKNCEIIKNIHGTAQAMLFTKNGTTIISMPGVPYEMQGIMKDYVLPRLNSLGDQVVIHETLLTANTPESILSELLTDVENNLPKNIKIAYLPHYNFVRLRITAKGNKEGFIKEEIESIKNIVFKIIEDYVIFKGDIRIEELVGKLLNSKNATVTFAESCTGGTLAKMLTSVSGCSNYFPGSVVTYSYENKTKILDIPNDKLWSQGAVSQEIAEQMAINVRKLNSTDYSVAISGIAGPTGGSLSKPVGTVWIAVSSGSRTVSKKYHFKGNREQNINFSAHVALELLRKEIVN